MLGSLGLTVQIQKFRSGFRNEELGWLSWLSVSVYRLNRGELSVAENEKILKVRKKTGNYFSCRVRKNILFLFGTDPICER